MMTVDDSLAAVGSTRSAQVQPLHSPWRLLDDTDGFVFLQRDSAHDPQPADWQARLLRLAQTTAGVAAVGAKRLARAGVIHSLGEMVVHPKGFHHVGRGVPAEAFRFPDEVDAITGGVMAVQREAFEAEGGTELLRGELGALSLSLTLRRGGIGLQPRDTGGRILSAPEVVVVDESFPQPSRAEEEAFQARFGFNWRAADLDIVRKLHGGTGICWNPRWWGGEVRYTKYESRPALHWKSYAEVPVYRARAEALVKFIAEQVRGGAVLDFGCGDGLFSHLLAQRGFQVTGIDVEASAIEQARMKTAAERYPGASPQFISAGVDAEPKGASFDAVVMLDVIEHLSNPVAVLRRLHQLLKQGGILAISTPQWQYGGWSDPVFHVCEYTAEELANQAQACGFEITQTGRIGAPYRDVIVTARAAGR